MTIDVFSATGSKIKTMELPEALFGSEVNWGLLHQAAVMQQANRRQSAAHVKTRGEVQGSTRKLYDQKHTGRARRGAVRSPLLRGGGKTFGPRNTMNHTKDMPKKMRHAAVRSALSAQAAKKSIIAIESYPDTIKTKTLADLLKKLPVEFGRNVLLVSPTAHASLQKSARNIDSVTTVRASYLNVEDILRSKHIVFLVDAFAEAEKVFGGAKTTAKIKKVMAKAPTAPKSPTKPKKASTKKSPKNS